MYKLILFTPEGRGIIGQTSKYEEVLEAQNHFLEKGRTAWILFINSKHHEEIDS